MKLSTGGDPTTRPADALHALAREHGRVFVLVDRFSNDPLLAELATLAPADRPRWFALEDAIFSDAPERAPALLQLKYRTASHMSLLDRTLELSLEEVSRPGQPRAVCAWIVTAAEGSSLARGMARGLDANANGQRIYLRYFDPRVMPRLVQLLGNGASSLASPASTWCQLGRQGEWLRFEAAQAPGATLGLRLDARQSAALGRVESINKVAACLALQGLELGHARDLEVDTALQGARDAGLHDSDDQQAYALRCVRDGDVFLRHSRLSEWVELARDAGVPFDAVMDQHDSGFAVE